ncbi:MAG: sugar phosphate isomerase/epimerase [Lentisphaerae bacterium]|nr:sugar phosphate isomerase/epimerase [Lentisphaerota bacterium]MBT4818544.1 sugar phosphate isomerase/epimerase [Lentisphaerota bacterium]MBT5612997.1 sugar phosphate isomerase/epimerase [Lentisphaerota bacterium]MBT7056757.1 sugar phosphate isomerase/epimerase [Lentisphaerota bacterium]MBT7843725.1 sugar phosphate isomerase/epimerase [Lentisphaerota bacterium]
MNAQVAVQMYTVRDFTKTAADFANSLEKCSNMGYKAVQLSAVGCMNGDDPEVSVEQGKQMLDDTGIRCIATHRPWDALMNDTEKEIAFHQTLACDFAAIGGIPKEYGHTLEGYRRFLGDAGPVIAKLKAAGIRFGHHNHAREFQAFDGVWLEDVLIDEGAPDLMMELDLYWVEHAGVNCVRVLERCNGRAPVIHIKDKEVIAEGPVMSPIGEGNMDWPYILPACDEAGVEWIAIEQDTCRRDPFDCLKASYDYLGQF